jgi:hypothetical protein
MVAADFAEATMARVTFEKGQRVYVRPLGCWATIERILPQWVKGVEAPLKIFYDVGLGRDFASGELAPVNAERNHAGNGFTTAEWRVRRVHAAVQFDPHAEHPGTVPSVVTEDSNWGGWRVEASEYDRDPNRIEHQARMIAAAPLLLAAAKALTAQADADPDRFPFELAIALEDARAALRVVYNVAAPQAAEDGLVTSSRLR